MQSSVHTSNDLNTSRQWTYQTCTEFGWYQSSSQNCTPFTNLFPLSFFEQQCVDIFGPKFNAASIQNSIDRTNRMYGGKSLQVTNVVFVHGSFDPWHALGITKVWCQPNTSAQYFRQTRKKLPNV